MTESTLPPEVRALVHGPVSTMAHVEMLLALRAVAPTARDVSALAAAAHVAEAATARRHLEGLAEAGLLARAGGDAFRYAPRDLALAAAADALAHMYDTKPVTLVRALYERPAAPPPTSSVQAFADAFRFGRRE